MNWKAYQESLEKSEENELVRAIVLVLYVIGIYAIL
jgi:hypothetical protein